MYLIYSNLVPNFVCTHRKLLNPANPFSTSFGNFIRQFRLKVLVSRPQITNANIECKAYIFGRHLGAMILCLVTLSITTLSIRTLSITTLLNDTA